MVVVVVLVVLVAGMDGDLARIDVAPILVVSSTLGRRGTQNFKTKVIATTGIRLCIPGFLTQQHMWFVLALFLFVGLPPPLLLLLLVLLLLVPTPRTPRTPTTAPVIVAHSTITGQVQTKLIRRRQGLQEVRG
jgi:hypothetical protein